MSSFIEKIVFYNPVSGSYRINPESARNKLNKKAAVSYHYETAALLMLCGVQKKDQSLNLSILL